MQPVMNIDEYLVVSVTLSISLTSQQILARGQERRTPWYQQQLFRLDLKRETKRMGDECA